FPVTQPNPAGLRGPPNGLPGPKRVLPRGRPPGHRRVRGASGAPPAPTGASPAGGAPHTGAGPPRWSGPHPPAPPAAALRPPPGGPATPGPWSRRPRPGSGAGRSGSRLEPGPGPAPRGPPPGRAPSRPIGPRPGRTWPGPDPWRAGRATPPLPPRPPAHPLLRPTKKQDPRRSGDPAHVGRFVPPLELAPDTQSVDGDGLVAIGHAQLRGDAAQELEGADGHADADGGSRLVSRRQGRLLAHRVDEPALQLAAQEGGGHLSPQADARLGAVRGRIGVGDDRVDHRGDGEGTPLQRQAEAHVVGHALRQATVPAGDLQVDAGTT